MNCAPLSLHGTRARLTAPTDEELMATYAHVASTVAGRAAFDELFRRYAGKVGAVLARGLRRPEDARDLVQQTFLQVHRHRADYEVTRPFRPWVYTIALNLKRQYLRTKGRRPENEFDERLDGQLCSTPTVHGFEQRELLQLGLSRLSPESAELVVMHWFGDIPMAEIAVILGISESAAKVRAHRAYHAMRVVLEQELAPGPAESDETKGGHEK
jgi:RNA polymerase sigma-70 factor, ECF subfamily